MGILTTLTLSIFMFYVISSSAESNFNNNGNGIHLNYLVFDNPPFDTFIPGPNGNFTYFGADLEVIKWLAERNKYTYGLVPINQTLADNIGFNEALFHQLINDQDIDGIATGLYLTLSRIERMDFTFFLVNEGYALIVPRREDEKSRYFAVFRPFQPLVWLMILGSVIATISIMTYFGWFYYFVTSVKISSASTNKTRTNVNNRKLNHEVIFNNLGLHFLYVINIMTNQGSREQFQRHSFRILVGVFLLAGMVLVNAYSSVKISSLAVRENNPSIESLEDLAASDDVGVVLRSDMPTGEKILSATSGVFKAIGDKARSKPGQIVTDMLEVNDKLLSGHYAFPHAKTFATGFVVKQYKTDGHCRFKVTDLSILSSGYYHFLVKKGSPYATKFNKAYMDLWESGLMRFWIKQRIPKAEKCFAIKREKESVRQVPIHFTDLVGAFLILGIGAGLAILSFLLELIYANFKKHSALLVRSQRVATTQVLSKPIRQANVIASVVPSLSPQLSLPPLPVR